MKKVAAKKLQAVKSKANISEKKELKESMKHDKTIKKDTKKA